MRRAIFLGFDSADADLLRRWGDEGLLPNFEALRQRSLGAAVRTPPGLGVGAKWISMYTGTSPARHRYQAPRWFDPAAFKMQPFSVFDMTEPPFWLELDALGKTVCAIDFPRSRPSDAPLRGLEVVDFATHDFEFPTVQTNPPKVANELRRRFGDNPSGRCDLVPMDRQAMKSFRDALIARVQTKTDLIEHVASTHDWDLLAAVFSDAHCICHRCWHLHDENHPRHDPEFACAEGNPVLDVFRAQDRALGRLLDLVGEDDLLMVYTGTQMGANYTGNHLLDEILRRIEWGRSTGESALLNALKAPYRRLLPMGLRIHLTPFVDGIDEMMLSRERRRRRFFSVPNNDLCGTVRLNVVGRERHGIVPPGEVDACCEWVAERLRELVNLESGEPLVREVIRSDEQYRGPYVDRLPDLFVDWNRSAPIRRVGSPRGWEVVGEHASDRTGDHLAGGRLWVRGPGLAEQGELARVVAAEDIAPTLSAALGVTLQHTDGSVVRELIPRGTG